MATAYQLASPVEQRWMGRNQRSERRFSLYPVIRESLEVLHRGQA